MSTNKHSNTDMTHGRKFLAATNTDLTKVSGGDDICDESYESGNLLALGTCLELWAIHDLYVKPAKEIKKMYDQYQVYAG